MIRRKARPIAILACIAVFLIFLFIRRGGREAFTFDSLPPYTDNDRYVKKPKPPSIPWNEPPPPPPDWDKRPFNEGSHEEQLQQHPPKADTRLPPHAQDLPTDVPIHRFPESGDTNSEKNFPGSRPPVNDGKDAKPSLADTPQSGHSGRPLTMPEQPPVPGDLEVDGQPIINRPLYTPEELAPRIEKYPIAPKDIIKLPKLKPLNLPKVQGVFRTESAEKRRIRSQRQSAIKRAMTRSWEAYSTYAMAHDEVRPVSGRYYNPFCGWGATLIDSLDTLQIMGMDKEYEHALKYVATIDFAHTPSYSIPLFETVIRYLGGLLGAYDISNGKDKILLEKAKDLADMLMGAFDTINRMPLLRYNWRPQAARYNLRASQTSCLAEIGTLTLEFTRLAQLTGNHSYYDAVQRITDGLEGFQFSHLPGLYPLHIDASGCQYEDMSVSIKPVEVVKEIDTNHDLHIDPSKLRKRAAVDNTPPQEDRHLEDTGRAEMGKAMRESLTEKHSSKEGQTPLTEQVQAVPKCEPQGLIPSIWHHTQEFSLGGEADSTYEYFIKEYILLGGAKEQYKNLYVKTVEAAENYLFFTPLVEGDPEILFSGKFKSQYEDDGTQGEGELHGEMEHLTCFVGGMLALGSKILNRPHDLVLAEKITNGCVWAYNITATGVMAESFSVDICHELPCHWTPPPIPTPLVDVPHTPPPENLPKLNNAPKVEHDDGNTPIPGKYGDHVTGEVNRYNERATVPKPLSPSTQVDQSRQGPPIPEGPDEDEMAEAPETIRSNSPSDVDPDVQKLAVDRQEAAKAQKRVDRPLSFNRMDARYILRPEAIESVFYMWRITGDPVWQEKGWRMWESIEQTTWTELAYSAVRDVNEVNGTKADSMESFWLAETLKYFYLLYSEPSLISLDEWVFNTEAHPFKRPRLGER